MVKKVETLLQDFFSTGQDGEKVVNFLEETRDQYEQVKNLFGCNPHMVNDM